MFKHLFYALRPIQWTKNILVFLPVLFDGKLFSLSIVLKATETFLAFCMASSSVYLINDLFDFEKDKAHHIKCLRAIPSRKLGAKQAIAAALILGILSCIVSLGLGIGLPVIVAIYLVFNFLYSKWFKHIVFIDVLCLGLFFSLRLLAGSYIVNISLSPWILLVVVLQVFFFGFNKRAQEFKILGKKAQEHRLVLVRYNSYFIDQMMAGITAITLIIYPLYAIAPDTIKKVGSARLLFTVPFFYLGIFRYLYLLQKWPKDENPARVIFSDFPMQIYIILWILTIIGVIYFAF